MAWSGNLRCLHCDGKLPLYRKLTSGQFCSKAHSDAYWQEQQRLAVERLHETHDSLRAYRAPADTLEAILGKPAASEPVSSAHYYEADGASGMESIEPQLEVSDMARSAANTGNVTFAGFVLEDKPGLRAWDAIRTAWNEEFILWPMSRPALPGSARDKQDYTLESVSAVPMPRFLANGFASLMRTQGERPAALQFVSRPVTELVLRPMSRSAIPGSVCENQECTLVSVAAVPMPRFLANGFASAIRTNGDDSAAVEFVSNPVEEIPLPFKPESVELSQLLPEVVEEMQENLPPFAESLMALGRFGPHVVPPAFGGQGPEPIETLGRTQNKRLSSTVDSPAVVAVTRLEPLAVSNAPKALAAGAQAGDGFVQPVEWSKGIGAPWMNLAIPVAESAMSLAPVSRYPIFDGLGAAAKATTDGLPASEALELRSATASPATQLASQSLELTLNTAKGCRYGVAIQRGPSQVLASATEIEQVPAPRKQLASQPIEMSLQAAPACTLAVASQLGTMAPSLASVDALGAKREPQIIPLPEELGRLEKSPQGATILPLAFRAKAIAPPAAVPLATSVENVYASNTPLNPALKFEPIEGLAKPPLHGFLAWTQSLTDAEERKHLWAHAADFWQHAPRDLKLLAVAVPILLGLALRPSLPKVQSAAPPTTQGISKNIGDGFREQFINVRNSVAQRAAVSLSEDFRSGLDEWQARGDMSSGWSFDGNGFVRPGTLALYKPSMALTDYDMDFLGMVDKKALSWVVRAKDFDNYYVVKLVMLKGGPLPTLGITRYAVIDGKAEARVDTKVAIDTRPDMLYRITMNVHDDTFLLSLQGSVVDNWTDSRLKRGGVGFFAPKGEESRLRWLQLTHQYDMLGRLCAYLAPYNIPTTNGSW